jgi:deoxyribodipyrimidine photo-lyase
MIERAIHWFRRDLRLDDNTALDVALDRAREIVPVFVFDPTILRRPDTGAPRLAFLLSCLRDLDNQLRRHGSGLVVRAGDPAEEVPRLAASTGATLVTFNRDVEPYARQRDSAVRAALERLGVAVEDAADQWLIEPGAVVSATGRPLTVFAPFRRRALAQLSLAPPAPVALDATLTRLAPAASLPVGRDWLPAPQLPAMALPPPGEAAARATLAAFAAGPIWQYAVDRNRPAVAGTSRLSPYLKFGVVSSRRCYAAAQSALVSGVSDTSGPATWRDELLWRDFYAQLLYHFPRVADGPFQTAGLDWDDNAEHLAAWQAGRTGFPIVDAGMRQLRAEGWMHNRVRMIAASFLCKHLHIHWQIGERHFMQWLVDGDLAANNGGWQWAASTGADAQPYFRIFNPTRQGERFDPTGAYVRRYVPELQRVLDADIHAPHLMPPDRQRAAGCRIGVDYPAPIVDHATERARTLQRYRAAAARRSVAASVEADHAAWRAR